MEFHVREYPRWALAKNKKYIPLKEFGIQEKTGDQHFRVDFLKVREFLKDGATLVFNNAEISHPAIRQACQSLSSVFQEDVFVNAYASFGTEPGFGLHYDDMDTLILQITGRKHWSLYGRLKGTPPPRGQRSHFFKAPPQEKLLELDLQAGDFLYLPAGYWHEVVALNEPSLHLTFSVFNRTGADFLQGLITKVTSDESLLSALPKNMDLKAQQAFCHKLLMLLESHVSPQGLDAFLRSHEKRPPFFAPLGLPYAVLKEPFVADPLCETDRISFICSSWSPWEETPQQGDVTFFALEKSWIFEKKYQSLVELLLDGAPSTIKELMQKLPHLAPEEVTSFIATYVTQGLFARERSSACL